ncbi:MAG: DNA-processing protein DprA [Actinobacteria bacterium]|nr:DNA-processing protein DprA [Actinomycetota bacterium]
MDQGNTASFATFLLTNRLDKSGPPPLTVKEFWEMQATTDDLASLLDLSPSQMMDTTGMLEDLAHRVHALLSQGRGAALVLEEFEHSGIKAMTLFDEVYPRRLLDQLGNAAPPLLFYAGDPNLLQAGSLGIVGSRNVGQEELDVTRTAARAAVANGMGITSGGARGVDQVAMQASFSAGGQVTGVLADSLTKALREPETRRAILEGQAIFLTHQSPSAGFNVGAAMSRNKIVYALATVTFVVTSALESGGTWAGAEEALRKGYGRVAVWMGEGRGLGNEVLVEKGAAPVTQTEDLFSLPPRPEETDLSEKVDQLQLGL